MRVFIQERDRRGIDYYEPAVFCEEHGKAEVDRIGMRWPEPWECCSSGWDRAGKLKTVVTVKKDDVTSKCQICDKDELDAVFQKTLAMLESI